VIQPPPAVIHDMISGKRVIIGILVAIALGAVVRALIMRTERVSVQSAKPVEGIPDDALLIDAEIAQPQSGSYALGRAEKTALLPIARAAFDSAAAGKDVTELPDNLQLLLCAGFKRRVFLTARSGDGASFRKSAARGSLAASVRAAAISLAGDIYERRNPADFSLRVDVSACADQIPPNQRVGFAATPLLAPIGIVVSEGGREGVVLPQEASYLTNGLAAGPVMQAASLAAGLKSGDWAEPRVNVSVIETISFGETSPGQGCVTLFRGRPWNVDAGREAVKGAVGEAVEFLLREQAKDGSFTPIYAPMGGEPAETETGSAAQSFAVLALCEAARDMPPGERREAVILAIKRGIAFLWNRARIPTWDARQGYLAETGLPDAEADLAACSAGLLTFCACNRLIPDSGLNDLMDRLGRFITFLQDSDGRFRLRMNVETHERATPIELEPFAERVESLAAWSLFELYRETRHPAWKEAAVTAARAQIKAMNETNGESDRMPFIHLPEALRAGRDCMDAPDVTAAARILEELAALQYVQGNYMFRDFEGGFVTSARFIGLHPPDTIMTSEALRALSIARSLYKDKNGVAENEEDAVRFLMRLRFGGDGLHACRNPELTKGGFRNSVVNNNVFLASHSSALMALKEYLNSLPGK